MADDGTFPAALINGAIAQISGRPDFCMVIASQDGFYDSIKFHISNATRAMTSYHIGLFKLTAAATMTKILTLGDVKAQFVAGRTLQVLSLPDPLDVVAGEIYYIGLLSVGGTAANLLGSSFVLPAIATHGPVTSGGSPELDMITTRSNTTQTAFTPATYTVLTSVGTTHSFRPWAALGNAIAPVRIPSYQVDTFNQINSPNLALPWAFRTDLSIPTWGIYNDCATPNVGASGAFAYRVTACRNDDHYVQVRLGADMATGPGNFDGDLYLGIRGGRGGAGTSVKLHVKANGTKAFRIVSTTTSYNNGGLTQRGAMADVPDFLAGDVVKIAAQGSVYVALLNDQPVVSWNDTGVVSPVDADHQWVNMMASATSTTSMQLVDNFECGAYGGGVSLVGVTSDTTAEADGPLTFKADVTPTPTRALMEIISHAPIIQTGPAVTPTRALMEIISYAPTIEVPTIIQTDSATKTNLPIPAGAVGAWIYMRGAGGGGGGGYATTLTAATRYGGGGGGGGAVLLRYFLRRNQMGDTYTLTKGAGGQGGGPGQDVGNGGGDSIFTSPATPPDRPYATTIYANGGSGGRAGVYSNTTPPADAAGGTVTVGPGFPGTVPPGAAGAYGRGYGDAANVSGVNSAGGGSGGYVSTGGSVQNGQDGADTPGASGGVGGTSHGPAGGTSSSPLVYGGGGGAGGCGYGGGSASNNAGGAGGNPGGGGGGAGAAANTSPNNRGGTGGAGAVLVEWVG